MNSIFKLSLICFFLYSLVSIAESCEANFNKEKNNHIQSDMSVGFLFSIASSSNLIVAVGLDGTLIGNKRTQNIIWFKKSINTYFVGVVWNGIEFIAVTISGEVYTYSEVKEEWVYLKSIYSRFDKKRIYNVRKLIFSEDDGYFVFSDTESANVFVSYSNDLKSWNTKRIVGYNNFGVINPKLKKSGFMLSAGGGMKSKLSLNFDSKEYEFKEIGVSFSDVVYDGKRHVMIKGLSVRESIDGKTWQNISDLRGLSAVGGSVGSSCPARYIYFVNGKYFIVDNRNSIYISDNAVDWTLFNLGRNSIYDFARIKDIIWDGSNYYAVGGRWNSAIFLSKDGLTWVDAVTN